MPIIMALIRATLAQLQAELQKVIVSTQPDRPTTAAIFQLMYNTGLRVGEVLRVDRWAELGPDNYEVVLSKGEVSREVARALVPEELQLRYDNQKPFEFETYSSVNNTFKYYGSGILFGSDTRRTTCHAFRYRYMKQLSEEGRTIAQIAETMGHINFANSAAYVQSEIWMGEQQ